MNGSTADLEALLPYALTGAQRRAVNDIASDMAKNSPMSRIIVGDVGCGKTVCAAAAMFIAVRSGRQAALMAPTEILARQHYCDLEPLFSRLGISCELLVGATTSAKKKKIYDALSSGELDTVIGTQALLSEGVSFASPGLVVTDEQHRFGVAQRAALAGKSGHAHTLVMSATPIPRSLALALIMAEGEICREDCGEYPVFLFDDVLSELDMKRQEFVLNRIGGGQTLISCCEDEGISKRTGGRVLFINDGRIS